MPVDLSNLNNPNLYCIRQTITFNIHVLYLSKKHADKSESFLFK